MIQHFTNFNIIAIVLLFAHTIRVIFAGINNLHTYDGIKTHDIINGDIFFEVIEPEELEYTYRLKPAKDFGGTFTQDIFKHRKHNFLVFAEPREACTPLENSDQLYGNIALIERGDCTFVTKAIMAEEAGAIGLIITDTKSDLNDDFFIEMVHDNSSREVDIPAGYLSGRNGRMIINTLHRYGLDRAIIKVPINLTFTPRELINHPPFYPQ
ncbi:PRADC1-like protein [Sitodiplosis mosellana]|uniref:PRADC1-like protein n=1 Tax=Sitodiplosis mosellana TaxID=263140 RepID=UPI00244494CB|nr:PRADC1-like protein [Sitodiplosis mosellana]